MEKRTLTMDASGYTLAGGNRELRVNVALVSRDDYTRNVEVLLKRMSNTLWDKDNKTWKSSLRPWNIEISIVAPVRLQPGFARSGIRVVFDTQPLGNIVPSVDEYVQNPVAARQEYFDEIDNDQGVQPWN